MEEGKAFQTDALSVWGSIVNERDIMLGCVYLQVLVYVCSVCSGASDW